MKSEPGMFWRFRWLVRNNRSRLPEHCPIGAVVSAHGTWVLRGLRDEAFGVANGFDGHDGAREFVEDAESYERGHRYGLRMRKLFPEAAT